MAPAASVWKYRVAPDCLLPFPQDSNEELERKYQEWRNQQRPVMAVHMVSGKYTYEIDFHGMQQTNTSCPERRKTRELVREEDPWMEVVRQKEKEIARLSAAYQEMSLQLNSKIQRLEQHLRQTEMKRQTLENKVAEQETDMQSHAQERHVLQRNIAELLQREPQWAIQKQRMEQRWQQERDTARSQVSRLEAKELQMQQSLREAQENADLANGQVDALKEKVNDLQRVAGHEGPVWQYHNHLDEWQPYASRDNAKIISLYKRWCDVGKPNDVYPVSDRYVINFTEHWQQSLISNKQRKVRQVCCDAEGPQAFGASSASMQGTAGGSGTPRMPQASARNRSKSTQKGGGSKSAVQQIKSLEDEVASLRSALDASRGGCDDLREEIAKMDSGEVVRQKDDKIRQLVRKVDQLESRHPQDEHHEQIERLRIREEEANSRCAAVVEEARQAQADLLASNQEAEKAKNAQAVKDAKNDSMKEKIDDLSKARLILEKDKDFAQKQLSQEVQSRESLMRLWLTESLRAEEQVKLLSNMEGRDESTLRETGMGLIDSASKDLLVASASMRATSLQLSDWMLQAFGGLTNADVLGDGPCHLQSPNADYRFIEHLFQRSLVKHRLNYHSDEWCECPQLCITRITQLAVRPKSLRTYKAEQNRIRKRPLPEMPFDMAGSVRALDPSNANEIFLWHGGPWDAVDQICKEGFDWKYRGANQGCMFGQGIYFAPNASKCDQYSLQSEGGTKCMLLARVMLGSSVPRWRKCTDVKALGKDHDSIHAASKHDDEEDVHLVDHPEVCIFSKVTALPMYKVEYYHKDGCRCHLCRREEA